MIKFITDIINRLGKLFTQPKRCLYIEEDGFGEGVRGVIFGKTLHRRFKKRYWKDIKEINGWNNDIATGLEFVFYNGKHKFIIDNDENWDNFIDELPMHFAGINIHNYRETCSLSWGKLPCWKQGQTIGNIRADLDKIVWEEDGSLFKESDES
jgi:hypothetical protein